jgi:nitroreductase
MIADPACVLRNAVAAAVMAPSAYNSQPWRFRIGDTWLDLYADPEREMPAIDPDGRRLVESCGCALFNARIAVRAMGYADEVTVMLVDRDRPGHLASLHLGGAFEASVDERALMTAIGRRTTNRRAFLPRPVSLATTEMLAAAAAVEGATLTRLDPTQKAELGALVAEADLVARRDPAFRAELVHWLLPARSHRKDGVPFPEHHAAPEAVRRSIASPTNVGRAAAPEAVRRSIASPTNVGRAAAPEAVRRSIEDAPVVIVLGTPRDDRASWLACGQALESVLLHAATLGLSAAFLDQMLAIPEVRARVAALAPEVGIPQMVLRLGVPVEPFEHHAPRRDLDAVFVD